MEEHLRGFRADSMGTAPGVPWGGLCLAAPRTLRSPGLHVGRAGAVAAAFTCPAVGGDPGRRSGGGSTGPGRVAFTPATATLLPPRRRRCLPGRGVTPGYPGRRPPPSLPPSLHHVQEAEAEDQRGADAAARGGGAGRPSPAAGTGGDTRCPSGGCEGGPGRRLVVPGRAPVAFQPRGGGAGPSRPALRPGKASGRTGPAAPPPPRPGRGEGGSARALASCVRWPGEGSGMGRPAGKRRAPGVGERRAAPLELRNPTLLLPNRLLSWPKPLRRLPRLFFFSSLLEWLSF